jgi:hypothetical protein
MLRDYRSWLVTGKLTPGREWDEARKANPVTITKADLRKLQKVSIQTRSTTPRPQSLSSSYLMLRRRAR